MHNVESISTKKKKSLQSNRASLLQGFHCLDPSFLTLERKYVFLQHERTTVLLLLHPSSRVVTIQELSDVVPAGACVPKTLGSLNPSGLSTGFGLLVRAQALSITSNLLQASTNISCGHHSLSFSYGHRSLSSKRFGHVLQVPDVFGPAILTYTCAPTTFFFILPSN